MLNVLNDIDVVGWIPDKNVAERIESAIGN
jgi:hypothetical protein